MSEPQSILNNKLLPAEGPITPEWAGQSVLWWDLERGPLTAAMGTQVTN